MKAGLLRHRKRARVLLVDRDKAALDKAKERLQWELDQRGQKNSRVDFACGQFSHISQHLKSVGWPQRVGGGILADFGVSSLQLDEAERGFSFTHDGPLDMRMNQGSDEVRLAGEHS